MNLRRVWFWAKCIVLGLLAVMVLAAGARFWLLRDRAGLQAVLDDPDLDLTTTVAEIPDGSGRFLALEKSGRVVWFKPPTHKIGGVVGDLRDRVKITSWEDGLLNVVFHPRFRENGYVYFFYSAAPPLHSVLERFTLDLAGPTLKPGSGKVLLTIPKSKPDHNGSGLAFGNDGYLYISVGDGNQESSGSTVTDLLASVLRIDVDRPSGGRAYGIPKDNPWADGKDGARPELWAIGLRNPWRMSYDAASGRLFAGDVGERTEEEIDIVQRGFDYGWDRVEGDFCHLPQGCGDLKTELPLAAFPRYIIRTVIGGYVYHGHALPRLAGQYVFGDYFRGVYAIDPDRKPTIHWPDVIVYQPWSTLPKAEGARTFISSLAQDHEGELYVVELAGGVYKLVPIPWWQGWWH